MEHNDEKVCMGAAEDRDVHGDGGRVRLVEPHPEVPLAAEQQQDEHAHVHQPGLALIHPRVVEVVQHRDQDLQDVAAFEDVVQELLVMLTQLPEQNQKLLVKMNLMNGAF